MEEGCRIERKIGLLEQRLEELDWEISRLDFYGCGKGAKARRLKEKRAGLRKEKEILGGSRAY